MNAALERYLREAGARYRVVALGGAVTAQEQARATSTSGWATAKVLVVMADAEPVLAVIPACSVLDLAALARLIGTPLRLATVEEAGAVTGCDPGAIPPLGRALGLRTFVDRTLLRAREIAMPGGDFATGLCMRPAEFRRLSGAQPGDFAVRLLIVPRHAAAARRTA